MQNSKISSITISNVRFTAAGPEEITSGLIGYVSVTLNGSLRLDGLALRRTADGRMTISYPSRKDGSGRKHPLIRPLDDASRKELETQILGALGLEELVR